jgi:adenylate kinase
MNLIFLGPPGSGKGTQAVRLALKHNLKHISTGDVLRKEMADNTALGMKIKEIVSKGQLVSDEMINEVVKNVLAEKDSYILDGYPRTVAQAIYLEEFLSKRNDKISVVFYFDVPRELLIKRLSGRRKCKQCGKDFNLYFHPSKKGENCDVCDVPLYQRPDDKEEVIIKRLSVYEAETKPLIDYYKQKNLLIKIDASRDIELVLNDMEKVLEKLK